MTTISEDRVIEVLTHGGLSATHWVLLAVAEEDLPLAWHPTDGPLACLIEEDGLAAAFVGHLKGIGARRFGSWGELVETATRENWPGSERVCQGGPQSG